ncbi:MAG: class II aldolase/adducin family protein [Clostridia bacterium]|nr:class II aldolase/adducin family protein [Clostridia bacterium]
MVVDINKVKDQVIEAGKRLVKEGLIARTWGNVSAKISDKQFVITPSGKTYESLTRDDIVVVNIEDLEYKGDVKPSSEKGVHAEVYKARPEINFIIHTHQIYASVIGVSGEKQDIPMGKYKALKGPVPAAKYGLSSTGILSNAVKQAVIDNPQSNAILMRHHGTVCMGLDYENTFEVAKELEDFCKSKVEVVDDRIIEKTETDVDLGSSERHGDIFVLTMKDGKSYTCGINSGAGIHGIAPRVSKLHAEIYATSDVSFITQYTGKYAVALSAKGKTIKPYLDDFAQIAGVDVKCVTLDKTNFRTASKDVAKALKNRNAVFVKDAGAICTGNTKSDVNAVELVLEKECLTNLYSKHTSHALPLSKADCFLMRTVYVMKYSKQAGY